MKTVSNYHFQFLLKPCGGLKINLKIEKGIWLKLNCGYYLPQILLVENYMRESEKRFNVLPNNALNLSSVMSHSMQLELAGWLSCVSMPSLSLSGS